MGRLPKPVELGLFRVLQESLTNIHRHSGSSSAEVALKLFPDKVILEVRDLGHGIPPERLKNFQGVGTNFGVGLAGMRERLRELGGSWRFDQSAAQLFQSQCHSGNQRKLSMLPLPIEIQLGK